MKLKSQLSLLSALVALSLPQVSKAAVLDFEDLSGNSGTMPVNYGGLTWSNWGHYDDPQSPYDPSSGVVRLWMPSESPSSIQFGGDVTLNSFWLAGYALGQTIEGYNNGSLVNSLILANSFNTFGTTMNLNWSGIDEVRLVDADGFGNRYLVLDDLSFNSANGVPDTGATLALVGGAIMGLAAFRRRFVR